MMMDAGRPITCGTAFVGEVEELVLPLLFHLAS
jgi:hypothetical protein